MTVVDQKKQFAPISDSGASASSSGNELLPFVQQDNQILIEASLLHKKLSSKTRFNDWINRRIEDFGFTENVDFYSNLSKSDGARKPSSFFLTIDMAKELAMLERSDIGQQVRRYFIQKEKELRGIPQLPTLAELFQGMTANLINGRRMFNYRDVLERSGYNPKAGSSRRRTYWNHFVKEGKDYFITEEFAQHLLHQKQVYNNRKAMMAAQPVLPFDNTQIQGGK